jgi:hypothetical protein
MPFTQDEKEAMTKRLEGRSLAGRDGAGGVKLLGVWLPHLTDRA